MISGVILAAGGSSRLGRPKQLLPLGGLPLLAHALRHATASSLDQVVLVLGHEAAAISAALGESAAPVKIVVNPNYAAGQSTSVRAGLDALDPTSHAALFLLGDQPQVGPGLIDALLTAYRATNPPLVVPTYGGRPGNPILFDRALFPELAAIEGDEGARGVVRAHAADALRLPVGAGPPPPDVDTEADYAALLAAWQG